MIWKSSGTQISGFTEYYNSTIAYHLSQLELCWLIGVYHNFQQLFSYIETTRLIVGEKPG